MVKVIAFYKMPASRQAFDEHYFETHLPLVKKLPELRSLETATVAASSSADNRCYRIEQLTFESQEDCDRAMASGAGRNLAQDFALFAGNDVTLYYAQVDP